MKEQFREINFRSSSLQQIDTVNRIVSDYSRIGLRLTLRQLYYQFVSRGYIENSDKAYKALGKVVNNGRLAGLIDWSAIEDRTRNLDAPPHWRNPEEIIRGAAHSYQEDLWRGQPHRVEVWVEKEALAGVIEQACEEYRVPFLSCRGYLSQSEAYAAGKRLARYGNKGQNPVIIHLGDHDPSGIDMSRDNEDRLREFSGSSLTFRRIALNMDQVEEHRPPPNPAKITDSRAMGYIDEYGPESWELDALEPELLIDLVKSTIRQYMVQDTWKDRTEAEATNRALIKECYQEWDAVSDFIKGISDRF